MALVNQNLVLDVVPGPIPPILYLTEYDENMEVVVTLMRRGQPFQIPTGTTVKIEGTLKGHPFSENGTPSGNTVTFMVSKNMTAYSGRSWTKIKLTKDSKPVSTCGFWLDCDRAGVEADTIIGAPGFEEQIKEAAEDWLEEQGFSSPTVSITDIEGGHRVTFTDAQHPQGQSIDVMDGEDTGVVTDDTLSIEGAAADAAVVGGKLSEIGAEKVFEGTSSENVDIAFNNKFASSELVSDEIYSHTTGEIVSYSGGTRSPSFLVKPGSIISPPLKVGIVFYDQNEEFLSGRDQAGVRFNATVPSKALYAAIYSKNGGWTRNPGYAGGYAYTNFDCKSYYVKSDSLHVDQENVDGLAESFKEVDEKFDNKLSLLLVFDGAESVSANIMLKDFALSDFTDGEYLNIYTGAVVAGTGCRSNEFAVKPGTNILLQTPGLKAVFFNYYHNYVGYAISPGINTTTPTVIPDDACYVAFSWQGRSLDNYTIERANRTMVDFKVSAIYMKYPNLRVDMSSENYSQISDFLADGTSEISRVLTTKNIQTVNRMRHAFRVASFNIYVGNANRWSEVKTFLQRFGIDMIGFQEVPNPLTPNSAGLTFEQALTSWHLSQFAVIQTEDVPGNCRPVAATGDFEIVKTEEVKYPQSMQSGWGHRHYTKTQIRLPRWKDKKWSEYIMVSIYNTQLEVGGTNAQQAEYLASAMAQDTNPFVILTGDFNDTTPNQSVWGVFKNAGYSAVLNDTSTGTASRSFYDNIFVNDRIQILESDVVPNDLNNSISDHSMVMADVVFDYTNIIAVKMTGDHVTFSGIDSNWLDRRQTEAVTVTVTPESGYSISDIVTGQGDFDVNYSNGAVVKSGNTITIKPNLVVGDVWIIVTTAAAS